MTTLTAAIVFGGLGLALGYLAAWKIHATPASYTVAGVREFLDQVVAGEEADLRERRLRTQLRRGGRETLPHPQSGPPARISKASMTRGRGETTS